MSIPSANDEYFIYQTLIGCYPFVADRDALVYVDPDVSTLSEASTVPVDEFSIEHDHETFVERLKGYIVKGINEAKVNTAWLHQN